MRQPAPITVLGASGWIGSALVKDLQRRRRPVRAIVRSQLEDWLSDDMPPGPVVFSIGLTADFREQPHATVDAHVSLLSRVLQKPGLNQFLFLSSTRVYARSESTYEDDPIPCLSSDPSDLYNLSKLMGESLVLQYQRSGFRVVRLSNVVGPLQPVSTFIGSILRDARSKGVVTIRQPPNSVKDYVALEDVVRLLPLLAESAQKRLYNLGSGRQTSHNQIASWLQKQGVEVKFSMSENSLLSFPALQMQSLEAEFDLPGEAFRQNLL